MPRVQCTKWSHRIAVCPWLPTHLLAAQQRKVAGHRKVTWVTSMGTSVATLSTPAKPPGCLWLFSFDAFLLVLLPAKKNFKNMEIILQVL